MPFIVRKNPRGLSAQFKLYLQVEKDGNRRYDYVPPKDFHHFGFDPTMTYEAACSLRTRLNKQSSTRAFAEKRARTEIRIKDEAKNYSAYVTDEEEFLKYAEKNLRFASFKSNKFRSHWHATKKMIAELKLNPTQFEDSKQLIYKYFAEQKFAVSYCEKLLRCLNLYGKFYSRKFKQYVEDVPAPTGYSRSDIDDAHFSKKPSGGASKPLKPAHFDKLGGEKGLKKEQLNWMYLSLWCGLRPFEVEQLRDNSDSFKWEVKEGVDILCVFQSKLKKLPRDKRWKRIPLVEPEQAKCKAIIESGEFEKPLIKTICRIIGEGYTCYAGRKGFEPLMTSRDHEFVNISRWMGHQDLNRTFRDYGDLTEVNFRKKAG